jgi:hypothetical protein
VRRAGPHPRRIEAPEQRKRKRGEKQRFTGAQLRRVRTEDKQIVEQTLSTHAILLLNDTNPSLENTIALSSGKEQERKKT